MLARLQQYVEKDITNEERNGHMAGPVVERYVKIIAAIHETEGKILKSLENLDAGELVGLFNGLRSVK